MATEAKLAGSRAMQHRKQRGSGNQDMAQLRKLKRRIVTLKQGGRTRGAFTPRRLSRALNPSTRSMVIPAVAERIMQAANDLGYRPDPVAASLRTGRSALVGILVPDIANTVFAPILSGASERLSAQGYSVIVADVGSDESRQFDLVAGLVAAPGRRPDPGNGQPGPIRWSRSASTRILRPCWSTAPKRSHDYRAVVSDDALGHAASRRSPDTTRPSPASGTSPGRHGTPRLPAPPRLQRRHCRKRPRFCRRTLRRGRGLHPG